MTSALADVTPQMTTDEFLDWDGDGHQGKLELVDGIVRAMAPASEAHGTIQANLAGLLWLHLRDQKSPCRVVTEAGVVPHINPGHNVRVPDLVVTCAPPEKGSKIVAQPVLLIEVLSPGNQKESWESLRASSTLPSLKEIVVVDSERIHVQLFHKDKDGNWAQAAEEFRQGDHVRLTSIEGELAVNDIYANTHLAGEAS